MYSVHAVNDSESKDEQVTLELLDAIAQRSDVSQRHLAAKLGIALGLTNSYLKRCAKKGLVKIKEVPANRYLYYLTPKGFAEKSRLTARFLSTSLRFYRQAAESCSELFGICESKGWRQVVLCGASDLAEIAYMRSAGHQIRVLGVYDPSFDGDDLVSLPVWGDWARAPAADAYLITGLDDPLTMYAAVAAHAGDGERVLVPRVLGLDTAIRDYQ
ncbi:MAG: winged helix-turn-helix transcriptional regulator [Arenicellales bacterium]